jgi:hypothetical protein
MIFKAGAMHMLVKALCTCLCSMVLMMHVRVIGYPYDELVIAKTIIGREWIWMTSRFLTTKIPSALLVAVMWLQHTRCPRFRRGTIGYGITTSPSREAEYEYGVFMRMHVSIPKLPKCICYVVHAQKATFILIHKVVSKTKNNSKLRIRLDLWVARNFGWNWDSPQILIWSQLAQIMPFEHYCWKRCLIQALHRWGFSEFPNNIRNYNAD